MNAICLMCMSNERIGETASGSERRSPLEVWRFLWRQLHRWALPTSHRRALPKSFTVNRCQNSTVDASLSTPTSKELQKMTVRFCSISLSPRSLNSRQIGNNTLCLTFQTCLRHSKLSHKKGLCGSIRSRCWRPTGGSGDTARGKGRVCA